MKVFLVAGARPNFMKIAPIYREATKYRAIECKIVHTGQHYDYDMSETFFEDLDLPRPSFFLDSGSGSHAVQTAKIMVGFEEICVKEKPDLVLVVGDVNSTLACSIVAKKLLIDVAHVEAGLRSFDKAMPEEINRIVTDSISDYLFVTEESGRRNLLSEGKSKERIYLVGHVMIDNLLYQLRRMEASGKNGFRKPDSPYLFVTLHRPSNVDNRETFLQIAQALDRLAGKRRIYFPVHPRTRKMMQTFDIRLSPNIALLTPLGYQDALAIWKDAEAVLTDSGGLQEETTALGVPCVTIRENTERPITIDLGTNVLAGTSATGILEGYRESMQKMRWATVPPLWDGKASERIWKILNKNFC
jgi:UDP-N-acetylglucosamine 2-epimerase (non-hydrolysing)